MTSYDVVVPTVGRPSLSILLSALGTGPGQVYVVDDRPDPRTPLSLPDRVVVLTSGGRGPAAARNLGWRAATREWVVFLDDDVQPRPDWRQQLAEDLAAAGPDVGGVQGRIVVPLPGRRAPTDWERNVAGLEGARWATADMAYRRAVLEEVGGFDERFPAAYREDADLGLRVTRAGWRTEAGRRIVEHPVRMADRWVSVRLQRGNADDALMRRLHGRGWRRAAGVAPGARPWHLATTGCLGLALLGAIRRQRGTTTAGALGWCGLTGRLAWKRISPGPRTGEEVITMALTSVLLPFAATWHWARGWLRPLCWMRTLCWMRSS